MNHKIIVRMVTGVLTIAVLLSGCAAKQTASASAELPDDETVTMQEAADYLLQAAAPYQSQRPSPEKLMDNFLGLEKDSELPKIQALIMVSRSFGQLPEPEGNQKRLADPAVDCSAAPEWAQEELVNLQRGGVLAATDITAPVQDSVQAPAQSETQQDGAETQTDTISESKQAGEASEPTAGDMYAPIKGKELKTLVRRIYALYGNNVKDDFYTAINGAELNTKEIPAGETDAGGTYDQRILVQKQVQSLIQEIVEGEGYKAGSMEQKIKAYYESAANMEARNQLGAEPLRPYLKAIEEAADIRALGAVQQESVKQIGSGSLLQVAYMTDQRDTQKTVATVLPAVEPMEAEKSTDRLNIRLLVLAGETEEEATAHIAAYNRLQQALDAYAPSAEEMQNTRYVSLEELQALFPGWDVKEIIEAAGGDAPTELCLMSPSLFEGFAKLMQDESQLEAIQTAVKLQLINENYANLSQDFLEAYDQFNQETMGQAASQNTAKEIGYAMVENSLGSYIDQLYAQRYFSAEAKQAAQEMIQQFLEVYKERIQKLDWMGESTKQAAIEKLDAMRFFIGYPDQWDHTLDSLTISDNFFENQVQIAKLQEKRNREESAARNQGELQPVMKIPVATVNAYYDQYTNTMCFPAGILQAPAFDVNASLEENLGGIGVTIAHEISHAFDQVGAQFDAKGLRRNWWEAADLEKFQQLCGQAASFYDGWESAPGIAINGRQTLAENIADIGGMACALDVLKKTDQPDYDRFFKAYAKGWLKCTTRERAQSLAEVDEHSSSNLRVNRVLANFQEFYDTYGIQAGDGMYVPEENRIRIW